MTHHEDDTTIERVMETLIENGLGGTSEARTESAKSNGFKDKTIKTRVGEIPLKIPQVRRLPKGTEGFYLKSLEKGIRSERAL